MKTVKVMPTKNTTVRLMLASGRSLTDIIRQTRISASVILATKARLDKGQSKLPAYFMS